MIEIISFEINSINTLGLLSEKIRLSRDKTPYELFKLIDKKNEKFLNSQNIKEFFNDINKNDKGIFSEDEICHILFRLYKMDRDYISYDDFQEIFTPIRVLENEENERKEEDVNNIKDMFSYNRINNFNKDNIDNDLRNSINEKSNSFIYNLYISYFISILIFLLFF